MSMDIYTPSNGDILHKTQADFSRRIIQNVVYLTQYDSELPVIEVSLFQNGEEYAVPDNIDVYIRWGNNDNTSVKTKCMRSSDYKKVYFRISSDMSSLFGVLNPILELVSGTNRAGSSSIPVVIDRNPVQN